MKYPPIQFTLSKSIPLLVVVPLDKNKTNQLQSQTPHINLIKIPKKKKNRNNN